MFYLQKFILTYGYNFISFIRKNRNNIKKKLVFDIVDMEKKTFQGNTLQMKRLLSKIQLIFLCYSLWKLNEHFFNNKNNFS